VPARAGIPGSGARHDRRHHHSARARPGPPRPAIGPDPPRAGATARHAPPQRSPPRRSWLYESRFDGFRGLLWRRSTDIVELLSRNLRDLATCFPELVEAGHARPAGTLVDAAIVIAESRWQFGLQSLQHRLATRGRTVAGEYRPLLLVFDVIEVNGGSVGDRPRARWSGVDARHQAARRPNDPRPWQVPDLLLGRKTTRLMPAHTAMPPTSALWAAWALALRGEPMDLANFGGCSTVKRFWERSNRTAAVIRASANGSIDLSISAVASAPAPADTLWIVRGVRSLAAFRCGLSRGNQPAVKPAQLTLRQLVDILTRFEVLEDKRRGRCWSPTAYTPGDTTRANDGVAAVSALVFDMDRVPPDPDRLASVYWLGHATWSHTPTAPHRRVVIPLTTRVPAAHGRDVWQRARAALCPEADPSCKDSSRQDYLPSHSGGVTVKATRHDAPLLDPATLPSLPPEPKRPEIERAPSAKVLRRSTNSHRRRGEAYMDSVIDSLEATAPGGRNAALNRAPGRSAAGWPAAHSTRPTSKTNSTVQLSATV
jgi:hypothetical protein